MRIFRIALVVGGLALVLSACGLVNSLVPNQTVTNPLGIDGSTVTMTAPAPTAGLTPQAPGTATSFGGHFSGTFADINASKIPNGVKPNGFDANIDVAATATIATSSPSTLPTSFDVTKVTLGLTVNDGAKAGGTPSFTLAPPYTHTGTLLHLTRTTACTTSPCTYSVSKGPDFGSALIGLALSSSDVNTLWTIVTSGQSTNYASGVIDVQVSNALPSDSALTVTLVSKDGTLTF